MLAVYGDGSASALSVTSQTDLSASQANYNFQYSSIYVATGATLIVPSGTILRSTGDVTINGTISVLPGTRTVPNGPANPGLGWAAAAQLTGGVGLSDAEASQLVTSHVGGGSGAHSGAVGVGSGAGGGALMIRSGGTLTVGGQINANGQAAASTGSSGGGAGGGAGGFISLMGKTAVTVNGTIAANGGNGGTAANGQGGGGGGGGIVHFFAPAVTLAGTVQVVGGAPGTTLGNGFAGFGGGANGGDGGNGGLDASVSSQGSAGRIIQTLTPSPENLVF